MILYASPCRCIQEIIYFNRNNKSDDFLCLLGRFGPGPKRSPRLQAALACDPVTRSRRRCFHVTQGRNRRGSSAPPTHHSAAAARHLASPALICRPPAPSSHRTPPGASSRSSFPSPSASPPPPSPRPRSQCLDATAYASYSSPPLPSIR